MLCACDALPIFSLPSQKLHLIVPVIKCTIVVSIQVNEKSFDLKEGI